MASSIGCSGQHSFKHSCATKQPPGHICHCPFPLPMKLNVTVRWLSCESLEHLLSDKLASFRLLKYLAFHTCIHCFYFFLAGYTLHLIMTLLNYLQTNLGNFGVPLQRCYDFGRHLMCVFAFQFVLFINQGLVGGGKRYGDIIIPFKHSPPWGTKLQKITWI